MIDFLKQSGACLVARTNDGLAPLDLAKKYGHAKLTDALAEK